MHITQDLGQIALVVAGGGQVPFQLNTIDRAWGLKGYRISQFVLSLRLTVTVAGGGALTPQQVLAWCNNIRLQAGGHTFVADINGLDLTMLHAEEFGRFLLPMFAALGAGVGQIVTVRIPMLMNSSVAFEDQDPYPDAELFRDGQLSFTTGPALINATATLTAGVARLNCSLQPKGDVGVASLGTIQKCNLNLDGKLPAGIWRSLILMPPCAVPNTPGVFAAAGADVTNVRVNSNGQDIHKAVPPDCVIDEYRMACINAETPPVIDILGGVGSWADDSANYTMLPVIWEGRNFSRGRLTEAVDTGNNPLDLHLQGAMAAGGAQYVGRFFEQLSLGQAQARLRRMGMDPSRLQLEPKTASKKAINPRRILTDDTGVRALYWKVKAGQDSAALGSYANRFGK